MNLRSSSRRPLSILAGVGIAVLLVSLIYGHLVSSQTIPLSADLLTLPVGAGEPAVSRLDPLEAVKINTGSSPRVLRITIPAAAIAGTAFLKLRISGGAWAWQESSKESVLRHCEGNRQPLQCQVPIDPNGHDPSIIIFTPTADNAVISDIHAISVTRAQTSGPSTMPLLLGLLCFVPVAAAIGAIKTPARRQRAAIIASLTFLVVLFSWQFLILAAVVGISYALLRALSAGFLRVSVYVLLLVVVLLLTKVVWPATASTLHIDMFWVFLPIGLSYLAARHIDLATKIATGQTSTPTVIDFIAYTFYWPSFTAGPITEITKFTATGSDYLSSSERFVGLTRVILGLLKKSIADAVYLVLVTQHFQNVLVFHDASSILTLAFFFGNMIYVYLDFSGYTDIALGTARLMGARLPENFDYPLIRTNLRAFWRHWHMSLTQWVGRMVFMPLSMSLRRQPRSISYAVPLVATTATIGIWHGLEFGWILWGIHHAAGLVLTDFVRDNFAKAKSRFGALSHPISIAVTSVFGVFFVWFWLMLSYCFTLSTNFSISTGAYIDLLTAPFSLILRHI